MAQILNLDRDWIALIEEKKKFSKNRNKAKSVFSVDLSYKNEFLSLKTEAEISSLGSELEKKQEKSIAIVNIRGVLSYSSDFLSELFGYTSYEQLDFVLSRLIASPKVSTIILRVSSPGGSAMGASEISEKIYNAREFKKIISFIDPYAFSAGYQIASASSEIYTVRSGMVGSVGSYVEHVEYSERLKQDGVKITYIYAGEKKVDGNIAEPLSDSAKEDIQEEVNFFYNQFVADLARNRSTSIDFVKENFGQGGRVLAEKALSVNMIDGILTLEELLSREAQSDVMLEQKVTSKKSAFNLAKSFIEMEKIKNEKS